MVEEGARELGLVMHSGHAAAGGCFPLPPFCWSSCCNRAAAACWFWVGLVPRVHTQRSAGYRLKQLAKATSCGHAAAVSS